jgi:hypothetical protein
MLIHNLPDMLLPLRYADMQYMTVQPFFPPTKRKPV